MRSNDLLGLISVWLDVEVSFGFQQGVQAQYLYGEAVVVVVVVWMFLAKQRTLQTYALIITNYWL